MRSDCGGQNVQWFKSQAADQDSNGAIESDGNERVAIAMYVYDSRADQLWESANIRRTDAFVP